MIYEGDLFDVLPTLAAESIDACVTDPPYGIGFMGKEWDSFTPTAAAARIVPSRTAGSDNPNLKGRTRSPASSPSAVEYDRSLRGQHGFQVWTERWAREVWRVLKPGAYLLVCGAPRSFHRMTCGLEDADFEIRDCLCWLYGQGFPKSLNLSDGRGTGLKPSWEPIILARKSPNSTLEQNVAQYSTGAMNIDACRMDDNRWPANVLLDQDAATAVNTQNGDSRFFYVAKPSREERDAGCDDLPQHTAAELTGRKPGSAGLNNPRAGIRSGSSRTDPDRTAIARNFHPTVKPLELMRWLVKLVTPPHGTVLDPFMGSGTTGMACRYELREFVGIDKEPEYVKLARARLTDVMPLFHQDEDEK